MAWVFNRFERDSELVDVLAEKIAGYLARGIEARGAASLAVSGGRSPKRLFQRLSRCNLDWERVTVTLVDERWLEAGHPDANATLVENHLLQQQAQRARFMPLKSDAPEPFAAEAEVNGRLRELPWPLDAAILGVGGDGHTASFFPGASTLDEALHPHGDKRCIAVDPPSAPYQRMTLTLPMLLDAHYLALHLLGREKWQVLQRALQPGSSDELPVRAVLHQSKVLLDIYYAGE